MEQLSKQIEEFFKERYKTWDGRVQFNGTAERLVRMIDELCWPIEKIDKEAKKHLKAVFKDGYNEMLLSGPTSVWTFCPHHLLLCNFKVFIGYIPNGEVVGISKLSRVAEIVGRRPIMQEQYVKELVDTLETNLKPKGVGIFVIGSHGCMQARGARQEGVTIATTALRGAFLEEASVKQEFYNMIERRQAQ